MVKNILMMSMVLLASAVCTAQAEEAFGIPVYPGAKQDAATQKKCGQRKDMKCFRTSDDFSKVMAFYEKQANLETTSFYKAMPPAMQKDQRTGKKKVSELCRKPAGDMCGIAELPAVRLNSPWSTNWNISPAAKPEEYDGKDVIIMITEKKK
jgi:hypothetical protein